MSIALEESLKFDLFWVIVWQASIHIRVQVMSEQYHGKLRVYQYQFHLCINRQAACFHTWKLGVGLLVLRCVSQL